MKILCSYLFFAICCWQAPAERAFFFQPNNELVTTSLALLKLDRGSEVMSELTVCTWLQVHHFREKTYVFSYATSDRDNNELNMGISTFVVGMDCVDVRSCVPTHCVQDAVNDLTSQIHLAAEASIPKGTVNLHSTAAVLPELPFLRKEMDSVLQH
ncbi:uncharacterized protein LOC134783242 [Penaeus indicus]|uniref:uncharacterized protein LOC134783242 n=1 Tax=Penaeus indicus TaxID=29960 RepID=UPI00300D9006